MKETIHIKRLKDPNATADLWIPLFASWQFATQHSEGKEETCKELLEKLFETRSNGYELHVGDFKFSVWVPTVLNQVVRLDGRTFRKSQPPRYRAFHEEAAFDIVCNPRPPYCMEYLDIDLVDEWGKSERGEVLFRSLINIGESFGIPIRLHDHAEVCTMLPRTFISFINNPERGRAHPNNYGFRRKASSKNPRTKQMVAAITSWRIKHQPQLLHFIGANGKINKNRIAELSEFMQAHLPQDLCHFCTKLTLTEYVKCPKDAKQLIFDQLVE